jgi:hypothetical protein
MHLRDAYVALDGVQKQRGAGHPRLAPLSAFALHHQGKSQ